MEWDTLAKEIHQSAKEKGFWSEENINKKIALVVSEIYEAVDAEIKEKKAKTTVIAESDFVSWFEANVKETLEDELADAIIRCLDLIALDDRVYNLDNVIKKTIEMIELDNATYFLYVGEIRNFSMALNRVASVILKYKREVYYEKVLILAISMIVFFCQEWNIDIKAHVYLKKRYNEALGLLHGKPCNV